MFSLHDAGYPASAFRRGGQFTQSATTRRWVFCSNPAIQFRSSSEAAIGPRVLSFSTWRSAKQRLLPVDGSNLTSSQWQVPESSSLSAASWHLRSLRCSRYSRPRPFAVIHPAETNRRRRPQTTPSAPMLFKPFEQSRVKNLGVDGLGQKIIHACRETPIFVFCKGIRRHRQDRRCLMVR